MRRVGAVLLGALSMIVAVTVASPVEAVPRGAGRDRPVGEITVTEISDSYSYPIELSEGGRLVGGLYPFDQTSAFLWRRGELTVLNPPSDRNFFPRAVNDRGQVVGQSAGFGGAAARGFIWSDGVLTELADDGGTSVAADVNERGQVLVNRTTPAPGYVTRAGVLHRGREVTSPDVDGGPITGAAIDERGQVVANRFSDQGPQAYLWRPGRAPVGLGTLGGGRSQASEINRSGSVLGYSANAEGQSRMFLWRHGRMTDLGTLGGDETYPSPYGSVQQPDQLNDRDQVVGTSYTETGESHAFLWTRGRMRDLGTLGGPSSEAVGVNDHGDVVGRSVNASGTYSAFLWRDGTMIDLGAVADAYYSEALSINDRGQVMGLRLDENNYAHALVWETRDRG